MTVGYEDDWTAKWVAEKILEEPIVKSTEVRPRNRIFIERYRKSDVLIATAAVERLDAKSLIAIVNEEADISFVCNVPRASYFTGDAIVWAIQQGIVLGGFGDLKRAIELENVREYVDSEFAFVQRCLDQHKKVATYKRLDDRRYKIVRKKLPSLVVLFLNEYELLAERIRDAKEQYREFDMIVRTNPNGRASAAATRVAKELGCQILDWQEFLSALWERDWRD